MCASHGFLPRSTVKSQIIKEIERELYGDENDDDDDEKSGEGHEESDGEDSTSKKIRLISNA